MVPYRDAETPGFGAMLRRFGAELRRCRSVSGLSQGRLADLSGVSQSSISRLERGKAPYASLQLIVRLGEAMNGRMPIAHCPHKHGCVWERLDESGNPAERRDATYDWRLGFRLPAALEDD
jgi:transcriptional regulator with XRE-family HTH domain